MSIPKELFDREFLWEQDLPGYCFNEQVIEERKAYNVCEGIFEYKDKFYKIRWNSSYFFGAWENEDDKPQPVEVFPVERQITVVEYVEQKPNE